MVASEDRSATTQPTEGAVAAAARLRKRLAETEEQLAATSEILAVLGASSAGEAEVFDAIVERARRLCRANAAQINLVHDHDLTMVHSVGLPPAYLQLAITEPVPRDRTSLIGRVSIDGRTQQIVDVLADPDYNRPEFQRLGGFRTIMGAPMIVVDQVVGVLSVWRTTVDPFDERVQDLLSTFAAQGALALRNVGLFHQLESRSEELSRKVEQLEALAEVGEAVSSSLDPDEVLTTIVSHAVQLSGTDGGSLMEYDEDTQLFRVRTAYGTSPEVLEQLRQSRIHVEESFVGRAAASGQVAQIPDLALVPLDPHLSTLYRAGWRSLVAIPLARPDRIVGALVVRRKQPGGFSDETCELLSAFASQSTIALVNARLYQQLERQSAELAEASQHKSEFLASMSHELRTPLNAVIGFSEVLLERMFGELNDRQADYLQDILSAGRHLLALLNDVLDLSKVEAGHMELDLSFFDAAQALGSALALVRERAAQHGIELTLDAPSADLGAVRADRLRFTQIVLNLLSNAVKFTPDGGTVEVVARRSDGNLVVTVADSGVGIAPADQVRIFDSFQQAGRNAASAEGTGLGLTLTRRIVELHGGRMWLDSAPGAGSTFGFSIPQPAVATTVPEPADWTLDEDDGRPVVVVIEDDESSAELVSVHIAAAGLRAVPVRTGEQGVAAVRSLHPAAVILDIRLPGMDGWDVLSSLKAEPETADTPVLVVSVLPEQGRGFALGAADYLVKPVGREELLAAVRRVVTDRPPAQSARRILVVDDDPVALRLVRVTLEPLGWDVRTCGQGTEAHAMVRAQRPAVLLVDLLMPDTDGFRVVEQVHADPDTRGIPIVVLTAKTLTPEDRRRLRGRVEFVASKGHLDLVQLSARLADLAGAHGAGGHGAGGHGADAGQVVS
ncbi:response regulator [Nostocoides sp. HKS02]|nr:response regulator [Tetrasphaera sp. HKS02]